MNTRQIDTKLEEILPHVEKPGRYIGGEWNSVRKDHTGRFRVALSYPDAYEVGISNIGLKILTHQINLREDMLCETVYTPWPDMEAAMRKHEIPLFSLESHTPIKDFDILGFSFQYEMLFTNFLAMLELSAIPLLSAERDETYPLIIGGGPGMSNPEPIAPFLDLVYIGEGESRLIEIAEETKAARQKDEPRSTLLKRLSRINGVYVPSLYRTETRNGFLINSGPRVERAVEADLNRIDFPVKQALPNIRAVQDRGVVEAARGCSRGCRFCQAGMTYRPVRERSVNEILRLAREVIANTGYREFSLISLSISDYSCLESLIELLDRQFSEHGISFSLPSLRLDSFNLGLAERVKQIRKSGLTFAVEGGTQRLRDSINKGVDEENLIEVIDIARKLGWRQVKLYFMIGLPGYEEQDEMGGIIDLVSRISSRFKGMKLTVSVAVFVPKPHTPYQWVSMLPVELAEAEFQRLLERFRRNRRVNIRFNSPRLSRLEAVMSRGDQRLAEVILSAYRNGARFDGWAEKHQPEIWENAFRENEIDPDFYLRALSTERDLPWDFIDSGVTKAFLKSERSKSDTANMTSDCAPQLDCKGCGVCDMDSLKDEEALESIRPRLAKRDRAKANENLIDDSFLSNVLVKNDAIGVSIRFQYTKQGLAKYLSPIDLEEVFLRAFIRANLPVKFSEGFNPHLRLEMSWALPIGFESQAEYAQLKLCEEWPADRFIQVISRELPDRISILKAKVYPFHNRMNKSAHSHIVRFRFDNPLSQQEVSERYQANRQYLKVTPKKEKVIALDDYIIDKDISDTEIEVSYLQTDGGARIQDIINAFSGYNVRSAAELRPLIVERYLSENDEKITILDAAKSNSHSNQS